MTLTLPVGGNGGGDFKRAPAGTHFAVCNMIADCGLQPGSQSFPIPKRKIYLRFEIPAERVEYEKDGVQVEGPITIGSYYTASMHEKSTFRKHLESWRGKKFTDEDAAKFDVSSIVGKPCMLSITEDTKGDKTYSNISSIGAMPKGMTAAPAENDLLIYTDYDDHKTFAKLPKWLQEKIEGQLNPAKPSASETHASDEWDH